MGYCSKKCNCSKKRVERVIQSLGNKEIGEMIDEGKDVDVSCQFCDNIYTFTKKDLERLVKKSSKKEEKEDE